jgi:hypothetical protein
MRLDKEPHHLAFPPNITQDKINGTCNKHKRDNCIQIFVRTPEGKSALRKHPHRLENNIKIDLKQGLRMYAGFIWVKIKSNGGLL